MCNLKTKNSIKPKNNKALDYLEHLLFFVKSCDTKLNNKYYFSILTF